MNAKLSIWYGRCRNCGRESLVKHDPAAVVSSHVCPNCGIFGPFDLVRESKKSFKEDATSGSADIPDPAEADPTAGSPLAAALQKLRGKHSAKP
jgi:hypothetical protein